MGSSHSSSKFETEPLLIKGKTKNMKWSKKLSKHLGTVIIFGLLLLSVIFLGYIFYYDEPPPEFISPKKATEFAKHILSEVTTNDGYLKKCSPRVNCDPSSKYRSMNGSCNNLRTPTWGAAKTPFFRLFNANYSDGYYALRLQTDGSALPNVRFINTELFLKREVYRVDENNVLLIPFGQLLAHDISGLATDNAKSDKGGIVDCCNDKNARQIYPQCFVSVEIPPDDPVFGINNRTCMTVSRAMTSRNYSCPLHPTTFLNVNTHFIDASEVYGSDEDTAVRLRLTEGGKLKFSVNNNGQVFCPIVQNRSILPIPFPHDVMFDSGDVTNVNQNLGISSMQTLFLRFHNYIASELSSINPQWSNEVLYQETRRIVIATKQRITYEDFLPIVIGDDFQESYGLNEENIYDPNINPSVSQEFSTAAYRTLHTIIPIQLNLMNNDYQLENTIILTDFLSKSDFLPVDDNFDKLLKGFLETPGRIPQHSYNFYISNFLFREEFNLNGTGTDLLSVDIMRGRDVGLQPYNRVRRLCGLPLAENFDNLLDLFHLKDIDKLKELYHSVDDIDLIVGLLLEKLSDGAIVGPTTQCLIADSFYRFKAGDRFFYDVQGQPGSFTPDQLKAIKTITFGHVLCTSSKIDHVQKDIFKMVDHKLFSTSKLKCDDKFYIDLKDWKESNDRPEL